MSKKTFYIILIVVAGALVIGGMIWFFFFRSATPAATPEGPGFTTPDQKNSFEWAPISEGLVVSAHFDGNDIFFSDFSGQFWRLADGEAKPSPITPAGIPNPAKTIPPAVKNLPLTDVVFKWIKPKQIAAISKPSGLAPGSLWTIDAVSARLTKIIDGKFGLEALFAPNGDNFVYSSVDRSGLNPILTAVKNGMAKNIENFSTITDKCAWAKDSVVLYCAVPPSWSDAALLPDDYYKNALTTMDNLWSVNTETGEKNILFQNIGDINNLDTNADDSVLIFISRDTGFLYRLKLTP